VDGAVAELASLRTGSRTRWARLLERLLADRRPHALALGCAGALDHVHRLAAANGATRQHAFVASNRRLSELVASLADRILAPDRPAVVAREVPQYLHQFRQKAAAYLPLARVLRLPHPDE
jgi:hypothetical protein